MQHHGAALVEGSVEMIQLMHGIGEVGIGGAREGLDFDFEHREMLDRRNLEDRRLGKRHLPELGDGLRIEKLGDQHRRGEQQAGEDGLPGHHLLKTGCR